MLSRRAFTLIELVVVIMILGILATIAVPKLLSEVDTASENSLRQTLSVVRDAIDVYRAKNGGKYPANVPTDIQVYLRGDLPKSPVGKRDAVVKTVNTATGTDLPFDDTTGWIYDTVDGRFYANCTDMSSDGATAFSKF